MNWCVKEQGYDAEKIEFLGNKMCIGNGYFGYRGTLEEYSKEQLVACTISEVFDDNGNGWREPVNVPNGIYTQVKYEGVPLSVLNGTIKAHEQELWIDTGMHKRKTVFETKDGNQIAIESGRFASLEDIHLLVMKYQVVADSDLSVQICTGIDSEIWDINGNHFAEKKWEAENGVRGILCKTIQSGTKIAVAEACCVKGAEFTEEIGTTTTILDVVLKKNQPVILEKYVAICKETDCKDVWKSAIEVISQAKKKGYESFKKTQADLWKERYDHLGIRIKGDEEAEQAVLYSAYLLYSSAPSHTDSVAIPARGLSGQVYKGAMFWDTEIYMLPMFAYCEPEIAKNLVMYRVQNLEGAREKAKEYGYTGAFYPWESQENGKDGCTHYNLTDVFTGRKIRTYFRDKQIHISADVVYGIWKYIQITGDKKILLEGAAEVILECARFLYSFSYYKKGKERYEFLDVTGADEYHERVNNDAYTNYMIHLTAKVALEVLEYLKKEYLQEYEQLLERLQYRGEIDNIKELYEKIYLPQPDEKGIIEQFDGYLKEEDLSIEKLYSRIIKSNEYLGSPCGLTVNTQIIKQADVVLLMSLLGDSFTAEVKEKNWSYYEPRTEHGSSLSTCIYALLAAQIGKTEWAYQYLMKAARIDLDGDYKLYLGDLYIGGTHPAANGGTWMVVVQGFAGLEVKEDGIEINPHLPEKWEELKFCFGYKGNRYQAVIRNGEMKISSKKENYGELKIYHEEKEYSCIAGKTLKIRYDNN